MNSIESNDLKYISTKIKECNNLRCLDISMNAYNLIDDNKITSKELNWIPEYLNNTLSLLNIGIYTIYLGNNSIGDEGIEILVKLLSDNKTLKIMNIGLILIYYRKQQYTTIRWKVYSRID